MLSSGQVFGSRTARSAYGMDSAGEPDEWWKDRAACRHDPDAWAQPGVAKQVWAAHVCRRHCPVLAECTRALQRQWDDGVHPKSIVVAGWRFTDTGRAKPTNTIGLRCVLCPPRLDTPVVEEQIAAYARLRQERDGPYYRRPA